MKVSSSLGLVETRPRGLIFESLEIPLDLIKAKV